MKYLTAPYATVEKLWRFSKVFQFRDFASAREMTHRGLKVKLFSTLFNMTLAIDPSSKTK